jgi:hypothetical protein
MPFGIQDHWALGLIFFKIWTRLSYRGRSRDEVRVWFNAAATPCSGSCQSTICRGDRWAGRAIA